jgi:hypothetical protein
MKDFGQWLTTISGICTVIPTVGAIVLWIGHRASRFWRSHSAVGEQREIIDSIDEAEKTVLRPFFLQNTSTIPVDRAAAAGLIHKGVLLMIGDRQVSTGRNFERGRPTATVRLSHWSRKRLLKKDWFIHRP